MGPGGVPLRIFANRMPAAPHFETVEIRVLHKLKWTNLYPYREHILELRSNPAQTRLLSDPAKSRVSDGEWHTQPEDLPALHAPYLPNHFELYVQYQPASQGEFMLKVHFNKSDFLAGHGQDVWIGTRRLHAMDEDHIKVELHRLHTWVEEHHTYHEYIMPHPIVDREFEEPDA